MIFSMDDSIINGASGSSTFALPPSPMVLRRTGRASADKAGPALGDCGSSVPSTFALRAMVDRSAALGDLGAGAAVDGHRAGARCQLRRRLPATADRGGRRRTL